MTVYRLTDLINQLKQTRETHGDLVLQRPSITAYNENLNHLVNVTPDNTEIIYED